MCVWYVLGKIIFIHVGINEDLSPLSLRGGGGSQSDTLLPIDIKQSIFMLIKC